MRRIEFADADEVAHAAARQIADEARSAVTARGQFVLAVSGGRTPWTMLRMLAELDVPWSHTHLFQVDERVAPQGHSDRNLTRLREYLLDRVPLPTAQIHEMPVDDPDVELAAERYAQGMRLVAGSPPVLDLVQLGLGTDGHTASLVPGDRVLDVVHSDVGVTDDYQGRRRMTMTYPLLNRARRVLWIVTGGEKTDMLQRLIDADPSIPAGRMQQDHAIVLTSR